MMCMSIDEEKRRRRKKEKTSRQAKLLFSQQAVFSFPLLIYWELHEIRFFDI